MKKGLFITFEGPEGSGKSTQVKLLLKRLQSVGADVLLTREPGGTKTGEAIRAILQHDKCGEPLCDETEIFLFLAGRAQLVNNVILPAISRGSVVVCDRFVDSTVAYQGYARGLGVEQAIAMNSVATQGLMPDLTLLLDLEVDEGFRRLALRNAHNNETCDRIEKESRAFHEKVREGYLALAERWPERFRIIDAAEGQNAVEEKIWKHVSLRLDAGEA